MPSKTKFYWFTQYTIIIYVDITVDVVSADTLREKLGSAVRNNDRPAIEQLIREVEAARYPELGLDLCEARKALHKMGGGFGG